MCMLESAKPETSMKITMFGFLLISFITSVPTFVGATNYQEYRKFDASCRAGKRHCDCTYGHMREPICCDYDQLCSCTNNVPHCHHGTR
jgi:hypothetical protein